MTTMCVADCSNIVAFDRSRMTRKQMTDDQVIIASIDRALLSKVSNSKLTQARVRALNHFHGDHMQMDRALRLAISWALCTTDNDPPPARAA